MKKQPFIQKTELRAAFEAAGYPVKGKAGITRKPGWTVDRAKRRRK